VVARRSAAVALGPFGGLRRELHVPMYRNAYALMVNTVVNPGLGLL
jgi:hypothetical protein